MSLWYFRWEVLFKLSLCGLRFLLVTSFSTWPWAGWSGQSTFGLLWVGDLCASLQLNSALLRSWPEFLGEGTAGFVGQLQEMGGQSLEGQLRVQLECCEWPPSGCPAGFLWSTVRHGVLWAHCRGSSSFLGWGWQAQLCHLPGYPKAGLPSSPWAFWLPGPA